MMLAYSNATLLSIVNLWVFGCSCSGVRRVRCAGVFGCSVRSCVTCSGCSAGVFGAGALGALCARVGRVRGWCWRVRCSVCCVRSGGRAVGRVGGWMHTPERAGFTRSVAGGRAWRPSLAPAPAWFYTERGAWWCSPAGQANTCATIFSGRKSWPHR